MSDEDILAELSRLYGIEPFYWDIHGTQHIASEETKRSLLAAMGVECGTRESEERSLDAALRKYWGESVPPIVIYWVGGEALTFEVRFLGTELPEVLEWELGASGQVPVMSMRVLEEKEVRGLRVSRREAVIDLRPESGYHLARFKLGRFERESLVLSAPSRCYFPEPVRRTFGIAAQLYSLRSDRNLGIGDVRDVADARRALAKCGAKFVGLNPLHALFERSPDNYIPYSPASRLGWSSLVIAVDAVPEFSKSEGVKRLLESEELKRRLAAARDAELVDYPAVWDLKLALLEELFRTFSAEERSSRRRQFEKFCAECTPGMREQAEFAALREHLLAKDTANWGWPAWPAEYRDPKSRTVAEFRSEHNQRIEFYLYLQWIADTQLKELSAKLRDAGVGLGLYLDLALGANIGGAETWFRQELYAFKAAMGAPPDELGPLGQNWGLPPLAGEAS